MNSLIPSLNILTDAVLTSFQQPGLGYYSPAFGAFARLVPDVVGNIAEGLELADSITCDGECTCLGTLPHLKITGHTLYGNPNVNH